MENAIDHEKKDKIYRAQCFDKVPLVPLHDLLKKRKQYAAMWDLESVDQCNEQIKKLLAL